MSGNANHHGSFLRITALLLAGLLLNGCVSTGFDGASFVPPEPQELNAFSGSDGSPMTWDQVVAMCDEADVVLIAEQHGHPVGLPTAAALFSRIVDDTENAALSLEFFDRDHQVAIDDYLAGVTTLEQFRKNARRRDPNPRLPQQGGIPAGHLAMIDKAKEAGLRVYASNAPRRYFKTLKDEEFDPDQDFTLAQKAMLVIPDSLIEGRYWEDFKEIMSMAHPPEGEGGDGEEPEMTDEEREEAEKQKAEAEKQLRESFRSMNIWDATMADTILRALDDGGRPVVHVVGNFHVNYNAGIPQRLAQARPGLKIRTVSFVDDWSDELREDDQDMGDCVIYMGPDPSRAEF